MSSIYLSKIHIFDIALIIYGSRNKPVLVIDFHVNIHKDSFLQKLDSVCLSVDIQFPPKKNLSIQSLFFFRLFLSFSVIIIGRKRLYIYNMPRQENVLKTTTFYPPKRFDYHYLHSYTSTTMTDHMCVCEKFLAWVFMNSLCNQ